MRSVDATIRFITFALALITLISCLISVSNNDIYRDGTWANAQWLGQDLVTLFLALPILLVSYFRGIRSDHTKWKIVFLGILFYYFYTYSFFMFAAELSLLYVFHLPIFGLSVFGLIVGIVRLFSINFNYQLNNKGLTISIISYLLIMSVMIGYLWIMDIYAHLTDPTHLSDTPDGKAPLIIYSLDLALVIPLMVASAILLINRRNIAYPVTGIVLTKTSTLGFALMAMALSMYIQDLNPDYFLIILWCIIGLIGSILTILFLRKLKIQRTAPN